MVGGRAGLKILGLPIRDHGQVNEGFGSFAREKCRVKFEEILFLVPPDDAMAATQK
jgi:hypothetical protein